MPKNEKWIKNNDDRNDNERIEEKWMKPVPAIVPAQQSFAGLAVRQT